MADGGVQPIKPLDLIAMTETVFPDAVIESFNELIGRKFLNGVATILLDDVIELMVQKGLDRREIYQNRWLNTGDIYRAVGWKVTYYQYVGTESTPATIIFESPVKQGVAV